MKLLILIALLGGPAFACEEGTKILWSFNQKEEKIKPARIKAAPICAHTKKQKAANLKFVFLKAGKVVFVQELYWEPIVRNEYLNNKQELAVKPEKMTVFNIVNIPLKLKEFDSYRVEVIRNGDVLGEGDFK